MIQRIFKKAQFKKILNWLDWVAFREPGAEHYNVRINIGNHLYWLRLQADVNNTIFALSAAEVIEKNGKEDFWPILKNKKIHILIETLFFIAFEENSYY